MCRRKQNRAELFLLLAALPAWLAGCGHQPEQPANARLEQASQLVQQGHNAYRRSDAVAAAGYFEAALQLDLSIENHAGIVNNRFNLAQALDAAGEAAAARKQLDALLADKTLPLAAEQRARAYAALALLAVKQGRPEEAQQRIDEARRFCGETCPSAAAILNIRARIELERGDPASALASAGAALPLLAGADRQAERANALRSIGQARLALGQIAATLDALQQALDLDRELGLPDRIVDDLLQLSRVHAANGNADIAGDFCRRALTVAQAAADAALVKRVREQRGSDHPC